MFTQFNIENLSLSNFRCFGEFSIDFNLVTRKVFSQGKSTEVGPLTVLVAKNGMGKTSILDAIRILFGTYVRTFSNNGKGAKSPVHAKSQDIRMFRDENGQLTQSDDMAVDGQVWLCGKKEFVCRSLDRKTDARTTSSDVSFITSCGRNLAESRKNTSSTNWPLLAFYGTKRLWSAPKTTGRTLLLLDNPIFGYDKCLDEEHNLQLVQNWLTKAVSKHNIDTADNLRKNPVIESQLMAISNSLEAVLSKEGYSSELTIESLLSELAIKHITSSGTIPLAISQLSDGVRAAFGLVADIAFRCAKLNPHLGTNAPKKTQGIVMIDEVDLHLHPAWQQTILNTLQLAFPNLQFIVTTHSPQVISSVPKECVRIIDPSQPLAYLPDEQTEGATAQRMLNDVFGTSSRLPPDTNELTFALNRYRDLIAAGKWDDPEAKGALSFLSSRMPADPELAELAMDVYLKEYQRRHSSEANS